MALRPSSSNRDTSSSPTSNLFFNVAIVVACFLLPDAPEGSGVPGVDAAPPSGIPVPDIAPVSGGWAASNAISSPRYAVVWTIANLQCRRAAVRQIEVLLVKLVR
eukprot:scpid62217/ scgid8804/ 